MRLETETHGEQARRERGGVVVGKFGRELEREKESDGRACTNTARMEGVELFGGRERQAQRCRR